MQVLGPVQLACGVGVHEQFLCAEERRLVREHGAGDLRCEVSLRRREK
jgi:hypothetical protein